MRTTLPYRTGTLAPELFVLGIAEIVSMQRMGPSALPLFLLALREARLEFAVAPVAPAPSPLSDVEKRAVSTTSFSATRRHYCVPTRHLCLAIRRE